MKHDQLLCDLIYLMIPQLMQKEEERRDSWVDPNGNLEMVKLATTSSIVLLPHEDSVLNYEGILKLNKEANLGHLKTALAAEINQRRPEKDQINSLYVTNINLLK